MFHPNIVQLEDKCKNFPGKSWNQFEKQCIDIYDLFDETAKNNGLVHNNIRIGSLGGSLSHNVTCGTDYNIATPYSVRDPDYSSSGMQYIEIRSAINYKKTDSEYNEFIMKGFLSPQQFVKLGTILDFNDNTKNQCSSHNPRACWNTYDSVLNNIDFYGVVDY